MRIGALGSGSDFTAFLQHDGVASLNIGFGGEDGGGIYHSIYDDFYWYTHFSDTDFSYGRALAQTGGTAMMRLADAELLPFEFGDFADTMEIYVKELKAAGAENARRYRGTQSRRLKKACSRPPTTQKAAGPSARGRRSRHF